MLRKWDLHDEKIKRQCLDSIVERIREEDDNEIGIIAAQDIMDIVAKYIGPNAYNLAIEDSKKLLQTKLTDLEIDLDMNKAII